MSKQTQPKSTNSLLAALPEAEYKRLIPHLERVAIGKGEVLHASDEPAEFVYFLEEGVASLSVSTDNGKTLQLSIVGNESVVGERAIFKDGVFIVRCAMITEGSGHRLPPAVFHKEFGRGGVLRDLVLSRIEARITETAQTTLCNQMHSIEERLSRWLLTFADRLHSEELPATQEFIADMLGLTRSEISRTAGALRESNLIDYARGRLTITNRTGLKIKACECYRVIKHAIKEFTNSKGVAAAALGGHATDAVAKGGNEMAKNEQTSKKVGKTASKQLKSGKTSKAAKSTAGSALTQRPDKGAKKR